MSRLSLDANVIMMNGGGCATGQNTVLEGSAEGLVGE